MELWVSGFNAWNQLTFSEERSELPEDVEAFECILEDELIEILQTTLVSTLVRTSKGVLLAGRPTSTTWKHLDNPENLSNIVVAGNDQVAEIRNGVLYGYTNLSHYIANTGTKHSLLGQIVQVAAGQTHFTALSDTADIYSWGDARYESTLGREVSAMFPAQKPCLMTDLADLPTGAIRKISSGGFVSGALTSSNDLYLWGGRIGQSAMLDGLTSEPTPFDLDGEDVLDVAVGNDHIMALSVSHRLFMVGNNSNSQLGLLDRKQVNGWVQVEPPLKQNQRIVGIHAGYKNSFLLIDNDIC